MLLPPRDPNSMCAPQTALDKLDSPDRRPHKLRAVSGCLACSHRCGLARAAATADWRVRSPLTGAPVADWRARPLLTVPVCVARARSLRHSRPKRAQSLKGMRRRPRKRPSDANGCPVDAVPPEGHARADRHPDTSDRAVPARYETPRATRPPNRVTSRLTRRNTSSLTLGEGCVSAAFGKHRAGGAT